MTSPEALNQFKEIPKGRFDVTFSEEDIQSYIGMKITLRHDGARTVSQPKQIDRLKFLPSNAHFDTYRSARASIAWLQQTRPDLCFAISSAARITENTFDKQAIQSYNSAVDYLRQTRDLCLVYPQLDSNSLRLACYVDAGNCHKEDGKCQIGFIIFLTDKTDRCCVLQFSSRRSRRVARSTTAGEALAFSEGFESAFALRADLIDILQYELPLIMLTDSEILFKIITRRRTTSERRLIIDIRAARAAYSEREISNIFLISSNVNPADALTKQKPNPALLNVLETNNLRHSIRQYVVEPAEPRRYI